MTERQLQAKERQYRTARARLENAGHARDDAIRVALRTGWTQRAIAKAIGVSPGRVGQIANGKR